MALGAIHVRLNQRKRPLSENTMSCPAYRSFQHLSFMSQFSSICKPKHRLVIFASVNETYLTAHLSASPSYLTQIPVPHMCIEEFSYSFNVSFPVPTCAVRAAYCVCVSVFPKIDFEPSTTSHLNSSTVKYGQCYSKYYTGVPRYQVDACGWLPRVPGCILQRAVVLIPTPPKRSAASSKSDGHRMDWYSSGQIII